MNFQILISLISVLIMASCYGDVESNFLSRTNTSDSNKIKSGTINEITQQIGDNILEIFEDSNGNLWFGTADHGVAKFDGEHLTYLTSDDGLCGKTVTDIVEDKDGALWFGTYSDMCLYRDGTFVYFPRTENEAVPTLGYGWKSVQVDNLGNIYVNTHHGIFYRNNLQNPMGNDQFTKFNIEVKTDGLQSYCNTAGVVSLYLIDQKGNQWFGTDGDGAYMYDGESFIHYTKEDGLLTNYVANIQEDSNGKIWFACTQAIGSRNQNGGLCLLDVSGDKKINGSIQNFHDVKGLTGTDIRTIRTDRVGNIWFGATGVGVYCYVVSNTKVDASSFKFYKEPEHINRAKGVHTEGLQSMLEDRNGKLWFGFSGGLYYLNGDEFVNVTKEEGWN